MLGEGADVGKSQWLEERPMAFGGQAWHANHPVLGQACTTRNFPTGYSSRSKTTFITFRPTNWFRLTCKFKMLWGSFNIHWLFQECNLYGNQERLYMALFRTFARVSHNIHILFLHFAFIWFSFNVTVQTLYWLEIMCEGSVHTHLILFQFIQVIIIICYKKDIGSGYDWEPLFKNSGVQWGCWTPLLHVHACWNSLTTGSGHGSGGQCWSHKINKLSILLDDMEDIQLRTSQDKV